MAIFQLNTIASESMVDIDNKEIAKAVDNQGNFCQNVMMLTGGK